ncbi:hypothetical protein [Vannielia sp. SX4]|uniref:hypothetical protein n=1 Tax=Vannielia sp. SX4 TaxID=3463852 RepID=UPI004059BA7C
MKPRGDYYDTLQVKAMNLQNMVTGALACLNDEQGDTAMTILYRCEELARELNQALDCVSLPEVAA